MAQQFDLGATVRLKSGGPNMTVKSFGDFAMGTEKDHYLCTWFNGKGEQREGTFAEHELELVNPETVVSFRLGRA